MRKMHQRRGAGGGVRACGARERARGRAERGEGSRERAQRERERETASPMVLHCGILWERR